MCSVPVDVMPFLNAETKRALVRAAEATTVVVVVSLVLEFSPNRTPVSIASCTCRVGSARSPVPHPPSAKSTQTDSTPQLRTFFDRISPTSHHLLPNVHGRSHERTRLC